MILYEDYIHQSKYARYLDEENRRETYKETIDRYCDFMLKQVEAKTDISKKDMEELREIMG
jgi:ribonucleoside-diphosphate reductase alpha chain